MKQIYILRTSTSVLEVTVLVVDTVHGRVTSALRNENMAMALIDNNDEKT